MDILDLEFFVEVQYDIFKILSPNNIYRSLPSESLLYEGKKLANLFLLILLSTVRTVKNIAKCLLNK